MKKKKFYIFLGTTAEFIKMVPVLKEFKNQKIPYKLITSGQNEIVFDITSGFLDQINVDLSFREKMYSSSILGFVLWAVRTLFIGSISLKKEFEGLNKKRCYFIVHGDTVSSLIGALIAKIYRLKLIHIESGLRSFDFLEPFPEELCRFIISGFADIHFCPNNWSVDNLKGVTGIKVNTFQNTLIETFSWAIKVRRKPKLKIKDKYFVLVVHRQEHIMFGRKKLVNWLSTL